MSRYTPFTWADDPAGGTPITAARLQAIEDGIDLDIPIVDIDATGTADGTTFLRGDGAWATPAGGGATDLEGLSDVDLTAPADRDVLRYQTSSSQWKNEPLVVDVAEIDATGTPSGTTYLRGDGTWSTPAGGGGGAVDSVNGATGAVVLDQDDIEDGTTYKQYSATEKTKLAGIEAAATANSSDAFLLDRDNHTGTQPVSSLDATGTPSSTTYLRGDGSWAAAAGGSGFARATASHTTASLADDALEKSTVNMAASFDLFEITADRACRVRLYRTTAQRDADETRPVGTLPTDTGADHGCFLEAIFTAADTFTIADGARGFVNSGIAVPITVTNLSGTTSTVDVDILYLPKE